MNTRASVPAARGRAGRLPPRPLPRRGPADPFEKLLGVRLGYMWRFWMQQGLAFWSMCLYLVVEYVRPQQAIAALEGLPLGQIVLALAFFGLLIGRESSTQLMGAGTGLLLAFTGIIVVSSITADSPAISFDNLRVWASWLAIYFLIVSVVNSKERYVLFTLVWLACHYYMSQGGFKQFAFRGFSFESYGITGQPGWFGNSGEFGIAMCMLFAISWHFYLCARPYLNLWRQIAVLGMPVTAALSVIGSSSRGALVGLAAIGVHLLVHSRRIKTVVLVLALAAASWFILPEEQKERFSSAGDDETSITRKVYWLNGLDMARSHPIFGVGYENWMTYYGQHYTNSEVSQTFRVNRAQLSHNIFIQCMAELGFVGLGGFIALIGCTLVLGHRTRRLASARAPAPQKQFFIHMSYALDGAMWSYLVAGFFVTVLYYPFFWINFAFVVALHAIAKRSFAAPNSPRRQLSAR